MARLEMAASDFGDGTTQGGSCDPLFELGLMYAAGRGVPADRIIAHKWLNLAALRGNSQARAYRQELSAEMSRAEVSKAQRLARQWLSRN